MTTRPKPDASRACRVLRVLAATADPLAIAEVARRCGVVDAHTRHTIGSLTHEGRVERVGPGRRDGGRDLRPVRITDDGRRALDAMLAHRTQPPKRKRLPVVTAAPPGAHMAPGRGPRRDDDCAHGEACLGAAAKAGWSAAHCPDRTCPECHGLGGDDCTGCGGTGCRWYQATPTARATDYASSGRSHYEAGCA